MHAALDLALLGLGVGGIYGLLGQGLVTVYRGSGVLNFAHGAIAMASAYLFYQCNVVFHWPVIITIAFVVLLSGLTGIIFQVVVMYPMRKSAPLTRVVATLALFIILESAFQIKFGSSILLVPAYLPTRALTLVQGMYIGEDQLIIFLIGLGLTVLLWYVSRFTQFGRATQAVAESQRTAAALGHSPNRIAAVNWGLGCALAGLAGCLIVPITGLDIPSLANLVIPAIAAAAVAKFRSFPVAFAAGIFVGIVEAEIGRYISTPGWGEAVPFLLIIAILAIRGTNLPVRGHVLQHLPAISKGLFKRRFLLIFLLVLISLTRLASENWQEAILTSLSAAIVGLSIVVATGYAGQISLVAYGLAAIGGLTASQLTLHEHFSLIPAMLLGSVATVVIGLIFALPAIRTRGISLAIVTLGLGVVISDVVLNNQSLTGSLSGIPIGNTTLFGWPINTEEHLNRYVLVVAVLFTGLVYLVINLRRSVTGRKMIAIRDNERAAAAMGVSVPSMKLTAFGISSFIAALGGVLIVYQASSADFQNGFDDLSSISILGLVVLGGIGFASGAVFGSALVAGGVFGELFFGWNAVAQYLPLFGAFALLVQLVTFPDGIMPGNFRIVSVWRDGLTRRRGSTGTGSVATVRRVPKLSGYGGNVVASTPREAARERGLTVQGLRVAFGGAVILEDVHFEVKPGEIVGLIGPNGAGKTTAIDAITGMVRSQGTVFLGEERIDRKSPQARAVRGLARSFQSIELFDDLTVGENLAVACEPWSPASLVRDLSWPSPVKLSASAQAAIKEFGLEDELHRDPGELSFARRRLVGIAQAVARAPAVLLLDEPGAGLDDREIAELGILIHSLAENWGMGVLLVEHHLDIVASTCDRIIVLDRGRILAEGRPEEVLRDEEVRAVYAGLGV
jgi:ABC-type branched-subunit amino acid transport system ATPase component/branched-subunit amino acid ABC-type transport system permease component